MKRTVKYNYFISFFFGAFLGLLALLTTAILLYISAFTSASGLGASELINIFKQARIKRAELKQDHIVIFLILGLDKRTDDLEQTLLTDTIMLASLNMEKNSLTIIPLPRDLWIPELKTKINALYFYGEEKGAGQGASYAMNQIHRITDALIDYFIVLDYADLPLLIDTVGAIKVTVAESFEDDQYPNPDFIKGSSDKPYITVKFEKGIQYFNGEQVLQYVRSRYSNGSEGGDTARMKRQTQVVQAVVDKLKGRRMLLEPYKLGSIFRFWNEKIYTDLETEEIVAFTFTVKPAQLHMKFVTLPVQDTNETSSILTHPLVSKYGLWVWEPIDPSWEELRKYIQNNLKN